MFIIENSKKYTTEKLYETQYTYRTDKDFETMAQSYVCTKFQKNTHNIISKAKAF